MSAEPIAFFQSPNICWNIRATNEFKRLSEQFRDELGHNVVMSKKRLKEEGKTLCGFLVSPGYKAMLITFCPELIQFPTRLGEPILMYGLPLKEDEEVSTIAFQF
jgi:hypothetical protein